MNNLVLYNYFRSSTSYRVRIALNYKNLDYTYKPIHLLKDGGEQNQEPYRQLNPIGGVPTLTHNGKSISQSMAIVEYLDEAFPQQKLFPTDIYLKNKTRQICEIINADIHPLQNLKVMKFLTDQFQLSEEQKNLWLKNWIESGLKAVEKTILEFYTQHFCMGSQVTAADMFLIPQLFSARRFNANVNAFPTLLKIEEKCLSLPAFQKAHPFCQIDTPDEFRNQRT
jgi:maleylacetoacetate isomerase/maleylpyruvate isomerase